MRTARAAPICSAPPRRRRSSSTATTRSSTPMTAQRSTPRGGSSTCSAGTARPCQQDYRLVGVDGGALGARPRRRHGARRARAAHGRCARHLGAAPCRGRARQRRLLRLEWLSSVDALTELFDRRHFSEVLRRVSRLGGGSGDRARRRRPLQAHQRHHGHQIGDVVLREIAAGSTTRPRPCDVTSRWGGEKFCVLLDEITDERELGAARQAVARIGLGHADRRRRPRVGDRHDLDRGRAAVGGMPHARAAARECGCRRSMRPSAAAAIRRASRAARRRSCRSTRPTASRASCRRSPRPPRSAAASRRCTPRRSPRSRPPWPSSSALPPADVELARLGGWLHDCGKVIRADRPARPQRAARREGACPRAPPRRRGRGARERRAGPR